MTSIPNPPIREPVKPPARVPTSPFNPDPKAHPIHPPLPEESIHQGTDPKKPVEQRRLPRLPDER